MLLFWVLVSQSVSSEAGLAPTASTKSIQAEELNEDLQRTAGAGLREFGGSATTQTLSIRSNPARDVTVTLEGVPLNSASAGIFDLGLLNPYGLGSAELIRGTYPPSGTASGGTLALRLPNEERIRLTLGRGTENSSFIGHELPFGTLTYDQADNDFNYSRNGETFTRQHNQHRRFNGRGWIRRSNWQLWGQVLYVDLNLPGSVEFAPSPSNTKTWQPTAAFQYRSGPWAANLRLQFQNQEVQAAGTNRWYSGGGQLKRQHSLTKNISFDLLFDQSADFLSAAAFDSDLRGVSAVVATAHWEVGAGQLISPRLRAEFVSDLERPFAIMPGLGARHNIFEDFFVLWNLQYISRAPNFNEMYFRIPNVYDPNPDLSREDSLTADFGYSLRARAFRLDQMLFYQRKNDLLETMTQNSGRSQVVNQGAARSMGLESDLSLQAAKDLSLKVQYTIQKTEVSAQDSSLFSGSLKGSTRNQYYQPTHRLSVVPIFFEGRIASIRFPTLFRSRVLATSSGNTIGHQWDFGFELKTQAVKVYLPLEFKLRAKNLLGWNREESFGYPLSNQPSVEAFLTALF